MAVHLICYSKSGSTLCSGETWWDDFDRCLPVHEIGSLELGKRTQLLPVVFESKFITDWPSVLSRVSHGIFQSAPISYTRRYLSRAVSSCKSLFFNE